MKFKDLKQTRQQLKACRWLPWQPGCGKQRLVKKVLSSSWQSQPKSSTCRESSGQHGWLLCSRNRGALPSPWIQQQWDLRSPVLRLKMNGVLLSPETQEQCEGRMPMERDIYLASLRRSAVAIMMSQQFKLGHTKAFLRIKVFRARRTATENSKISLQP